MSDELDDDDALTNPLSNPQRRHPRARELLPNHEFFTVDNDLAPFGSDEDGKPIRSGGGGVYETRRPT